MAPMGPPRPVDDRPSRLSIVAEMRDLDRTTPEPIEPRSQSTMEWDDSPPAKEKVTTWKKIRKVASYSTLRTRQSISNIRAGTFSTVDLASEAGRSSRDQAGSPETTRPRHIPIDTSKYEKMATEAPPVPRIPEVYRSKIPPRPISTLGKAPPTHQSKRAAPKVSSNPYEGFDELTEQDPESALPESVEEVTPWEFSPEQTPPPLSPTFEEDEDVRPGTPKSTRIPPLRARASMPYMRDQASAASLSSEFTDATPTARKQRKLTKRQSPGIATSESSLNTPDVPGSASLQRQHTSSLGSGDTPVFAPSFTLPETPSKPSGTWPKGPEDPDWDHAVAKVRKQVAEEQAAERKEQKRTAKLEAKAAREASKEHEGEGRFQWAKRAFDALISKSAETGYQLKKPPGEMSEAEWQIVQDSMNGRNTVGLRETFFERADGDKPFVYPVIDYTGPQHRKDRPEEPEGTIASPAGPAVRSTSSRSLGLGIGGDVPATLSPPIYRFNNIDVPVHHLDGFLASQGLPTPVSGNAFAEAAGLIPRPSQEVTAKIKDKLISGEDVSGHGTRRGSIDFEEDKPLDVKRYSVLKKQVSLNDMAVLPDGAQLRRGDSFRRGITMARDLAVARGVGTGLSHPARRDAGTSQAVHPALREQVTPSLVMATQATTHPALRSTSQATVVVSPPAGTGEPAAPVRTTVAQESRTRPVSTIAPLTATSPWLDHPEQSRFATWSMAGPSRESSTSESCEMAELEGSPVPETSPVAIPQPSRSPPPPPAAATETLRPRRQHNNRPPIPTVLEVPLGVPLQGKYPRARLSAARELRAARPELRVATDPAGSPQQASTGQPVFIAPRVSQATDSPSSPPPDSAYRDSNPVSVSTAPTSPDALIIPELQQAIAGLAGLADKGKGRAAGARWPQAPYRDPIGRKPSTPVLAERAESSIATSGMPQPGFTVPVPAAPTEGQWLRSPSEQEMLTPQPLRIRPRVATSPNPTSPAPGTSVTAIYSPETRAVTLPTAVRGSISERPLPALPPGGEAIREREERNSFDTCTIALAEVIQPPVQPVPSTPRGMRSFFTQKTRTPNENSSNEAGPSTSASRVRLLTGNLFASEPESPDLRVSSNSHLPSIPSAMQNVSLDSVVNLWQRAGSFEARNAGSTSLAARTSGIQTIRIELGLPPMRNRLANDPKHPNHSQEWATKKLMCYQKHHQDPSRLA
ncbi:hypothetical protein B0A48_11854 [Cryoendolithus antarcticus]|uniref:Uncharacterized protein n=1 Tax=Cryoendolithus antarcticus TaxID=1507870 RepID=A0A1V8STB0_9PEZI|nr:hypothetical protein B0A48_11854 [Cryoendolithus antarcticus]